jgi:hypothetical protein
MKFLIGILLFISITSCSSDDDRNVIDNNVKVNGNWKPYKYEFRGKTIQLNDCEQKGLILINPDFSGSYERYETSTSGACTNPDSFTGKWVYDNLYSSLTLTYIESGVTKTLKKEVQSFSETEMSISDKSKNLDDVPGNDQATLVFRKE